MAEIAARRGDTARAAAVLAAARARVSVRDAVPDRMWLERTTGAVAAAAGRLQEAQAAFRASIELSPDSVHDRPLAVWAITEALTVESDIAEVGRSRSPAPAGTADPAWSARLFAIADAIAADSEAETAPAMVLFVAHARAERTRFEGRWDVSAWADVVAAADAAKQPWDAAWARTREAEARLVVDRDRETATVLLRAARAVADELRDRQLQDRIDRLATSARLDVTGAADEEAVVDDTVNVPATGPDFRRGNVRSSPWYPMGAPIARSPMPCSSRRRRPASMSATSSTSWACPAGSRRP